MPFIKLQFKPGVNRDQTDYSNEGGWYECDKIRFRSGYPQKLGGWIKSSALSFIGYCRQMWNWTTTYADNLMALGTNAKLYIEAGGYYYDITPLRDVDPTYTGTNTNNSVSVTNASNVVVIKLAVAHNALSGNFVVVSGVAGTGSPAAIGGIPITQINGNHELTVVNSTAFSFTTANSATSTNSNTGGTSITVSFEYDTGNAIATGGYGWGVGAWGRDAWGLGTTAAPISLPQRDWWLDNFDNDLVANVRNGPIFWWSRGTNSDPATALDSKAIWLKDLAYDWAITQGYSAGVAQTYADAVPSIAMQTLVSQQDKHLIAFGSVPFGGTSNDFDPLLIRWADQDTPEDWIPSQTNTAGDLRVSRGSRIVRAMPTRQEILVWTDSNLYTLQFLGTTDVFGLQEYADNVSVISARCMGSAANITYWMGQDKFYAYTGRVETLPCTLRDHVFNNINLAQIDQIICGTNEQWNEVWWFYPTESSDYNDAYVVYNHLERIWYYGTMPRTAWLDTPLRHYPQSANTVGGASIGYVFSQELGLDEDGAPMLSYIRSSDFDLGDGDQLMLTRRVIPDIDLAGSTAQTPEVTMELRYRNFPGSALQTETEDNAKVIQTTVGQYSAQLFLRARARQMALKIMSENLGVNWQLGAPRLDARPDGRR